MARELVPIVIKTDKCEASVIGYCDGELNRDVVREIRRAVETLIHRENDSIIIGLQRLFPAYKFNVCLVNSISVEIED